MYSLARELLFKLSPETSHELSIDLIGAGGRLGRWLGARPLGAPKCYGAGCALRSELRLTERVWSHLP